MHITGDISSVRACILQVRILISHFGNAQESCEISIRFHKHIQDITYIQEGISHQCCAVLQNNSPTTLHMPRKRPAIKGKASHPIIFAFPPEIKKREAHNTSHHLPLSIMFIPLLQLVFPSSLAHYTTHGGGEVFYAFTGFAVDFTGAFTR